MKKATFTEIMQQNGFQYTGKTSYDGQFIFCREWRKIANVLWYGEMESSFRIEAYERCGYPVVTLYENGRQIDFRSYSSLKRCINALFRPVSGHPRPRLRGAIASNRRPLVAQARPLCEILEIRGYEF